MHLFAGNMLTHCLSVVVLVFFSTDDEVKDEHFYYAREDPRHNFLDISQLNTQTKFKYHGNKDGAVAAIKYLEECGIGVVLEELCNRGTSKVCMYMYTHQDMYVDIQMQEESYQAPYARESILVCVRPE